MCGIAGFWQIGQTTEAAEKIATAMALRIESRGPDDWGVWSDVSAGITFSHRRLSILDLSAAGHQPMFSHSGRYVLTFNGEIYNHLELRDQLQSVQWRGHADTETLLAGFDAWGIETTLKKSAGMFALAVWDRRERVLSLARDRMGEKPLYYGWQGTAFVFGSQLKALKTHPHFRSEIDRDALTLFMRHNYIPAPHSIYTGIGKLPPGTILNLQLTGDSAHPAAKPEPYWQLGEIAVSGLQNPFKGGEREAQDALEERLRSAIKLQMIADVPLGAFLSGGLDSSTVVALMQAQSSRPVKTFTIGFHEAEFNEADKARAVARHLGTDHTELYLSVDAARDVIPRLPELYDEPFADSSQIPNFLVSQLARQHVTVSLSGDAGDELFGGYKRYFQALGIWRRFASLPGFSRQLTAGIIRMIPAAAWNGVGAAVRPMLARDRREWLLAGRAFNVAELLCVRNPVDLYHRLMSDWRRPEDVVVGGTEPQTIFQQPSNWPKNAEFAQLMMYLDCMTYLPDEILAKVDRAAMGVSLETRVPLLDHRVVEFAWQLPLSFKMRGGQGKWILRQILHKYVPKELTEGPKRGFTVPIDRWLRGPLRDWAESLLNTDRLKREGFFRPGPVREKWRQHLAREYEWHTHIWNVLMFQSWLERQTV